jgi:hypothetical protein
VPAALAAPLRILTVAREAIHQHLVFLQPVEVLVHLVPIVPLVLKTVAMVALVEAQAHIMDLVLELEMRGDIHRLKEIMAQEKALNHRLLIYVIVVVAVVELVLVVLIKMVVTEQTHQFLVLA